MPDALPGPVPDILALFKDYLVSPSRAAKKCPQKGALLQNAWIYAAFFIASYLFYYFKPPDFPEGYALASGAQDRGDLILALLWEIPGEIFWIAALGGLLAFFHKGSWPARLGAAVLWSAAPFALIFSAKAGMLPSFGLAAGMAAIIGLFTPLWRQTTRAEWRAMAGFMLGINAIGLVVTVPMILSVLLRSDRFFEGAQIVGGFWFLGAGVIGLREITGLRLPRVFMALFLSLFFQVAAVLALSTLGLVSPAVLKVLFYA